MDKLTESEKLFMEFCALNGFEINRLAVSDIPGKRTPDFDLFTKSGLIIVEIKQFNPNKEEEKLLQELEEKGWTRAFGKEPGNKARKKIRKGIGQLKARAKGKFPTLLVLYSSNPLTSRGVDPYEIKTAMYGVEIVKGDLFSNGEVSNLDRKFGPKRKMTPTSNTSISAIATLRWDFNDELTLSVYHNIYAEIPLPIDALQKPTIRHYTLNEKKPGLHQDWEEIKVTQEWRGQQR